MAGRPDSGAGAAARHAGPAADCRDLAYIAAPETHPGAAEMAALEELLAKAKRPMLLIAAAAGMRKPRPDRPLCPPLRSAGGEQLSPCAAVRPDPANYAGDLGLQANPKLVARVKNSDLVIAAGRGSTRPPARIYVVRDGQALVHAYPKPASSAGYSVPNFPSMPANRLRRGPGSPDAAPASRWSEETRAANAEYRPSRIRRCRSRAK